MKKKILALVLAASVGLLPLGGCVPKSDPQKEAPATNNSTAAASGQPAPVELKPLRVAVQSFYCSSAVGLIMDKGWDKEAGISIEPIVFNGGAPINEAMAAGLWDVAVTGGAYIFAMANYDAKLIASQIDGRGGNLIFAREGSPILKKKGFNPEYPNIYGSPDDVKGITLLQNTGTTSQYTAVNWLDKLGVKEEEVNIVHMDFAQMFQGFVAGQGDAASLAPPHSYVDAKEKGWVQVASLEDCGGELYEATVCTKDAYENRRADIVKFVKLLYRANDALIADPQLKFDTVKKWYSDNGKSLSDQEIQSEIDTKPFISSAQAKQMDLGKFAEQYGEFYVKIDKIEPEKMANIKAGVANDILQEALSSTTGN